MKLLRILVLVLALSGCSLQTLGAPKGDFTLYAVFDDVQNLVAGHSVQMSDVHIGTVTGVALQGFRARVTMSIVDGTSIAAGSTATLAKTALLGENYVRINPPAAATGALASGASIAQTSVQPGLEQVGERVSPVIAALGGQDLERTLTGLAIGLDGQGPKLNKIIKQASQISDSYAAARKDLADVIDGLGRLGDSLAASSGALDRLPGTLLVATERVQKDRKELKQAVQDLTAMATAVNSKIKDRHGARMRTLLLRLDRIMRKMINGRQDLKAIADSLLNGFAKAPSMTYAGQGLINVWLDGFLPTQRNSRPKDDLGDSLERLLAPR